MRLAGGGGGRITSKSSELLEGEKSVEGWAINIASMYNSAVYWLGMYECACSCPINDSGAVNWFWLNTRAYDCMRSWFIYDPCSVYWFWLNVGAYNCPSYWLIDNTCAVNWLWLYSSAYNSACSRFIDNAGLVYWLSACVHNSACSRPINYSGSVDWLSAYECSWFVYNSGAVDGLNNSFGDSLVDWFWLHTCMDNRLDDWLCYHTCFGACDSLCHDTCDRFCGSAYFSLCGEVPTEDVGYSYNTSNRTDDTSNDCDFLS